MRDYDSYSVAATESIVRKKSGARMIYIGIIVGLAVMLAAMTAAFVARDFGKNSAEARLNDYYFESVSELSDSVDEVVLNLSKLSLNMSRATTSETLNELSTYASEGASALSRLPIDGERTYPAMKLLNQIVDFAAAYNSAVGRGYDTDGYVKSAAKFRRAAETLQQRVDEMEEISRRNGRITSDFFSPSNMAVGDDRQEVTPDYPEMIYDGPFSDSMENREPIALKGEIINELKGAEIVVDYLGGLGAKNIKFIGEGNGDIPTLNYSLTIEGMEAFAQLSKQGGRLVLFNMATASDSEPAARQDAGPTCQQNALSFARKLGFDNMQVVWSSSMDGECYINLAPVDNDVILYSDLVKVKVRERDSHVIGFDATHYAYNHRERTIPAPAISAEQAEKTLSIPAVTEGRLALIPLNGAREVLTYEFECERDGTYFVYIDALTGDEANILYVVDDAGLGSQTM